MATALGLALGGQRKRRSPVSALVREEFERVRRPKRNYLVLPDLLKINPRDAGLPLSGLDDLALLWTLDRSKTGRVFLADLASFAEGCRRACEGVPPFERESAVRGRCALELWSAARRPPDGPARLGAWVGALAAEASPETRRFWRQGVGRCVPLEAVAPLHRVLRLGPALGLDLQAFFDLLQRAAEARGLLDLREPAQDDWVPLEAIREFARRLPEGAGELLDDVGGDAVPGWGDADDATKGAKATK